MKKMRLRWLAIPLLMVVAPLALRQAASAQVFVSFGINIGPPALPVYVQPPCPGPDLIWQPGYWAWSPGGYYWVPGAWVAAPEPGLLWTPGWWGWRDDAYYWHPGYWGPRVGFYGGINYGFGYFGVGYVGGYWDHDRFRYNRAVDRLGPEADHYGYYRGVNPAWFHGSRASFNGPGGIRARANREQLQDARERRFGATREQMRQVTMACSQRSLRANFNHGRPPIAATVRPGQFRGGPQRFAAPRRGPQPNRGNWRSFNRGPARQARPQSGPARGRAYRPAPRGRAYRSAPRGQYSRPTYRQRSPRQPARQQYQNRRAPRRNARPAPRRMQRSAPRRGRSAAPQRRGHGRPPHRHGRGFGRR